MSKPCVQKTIMSNLTVKKKTGDSNDTSYSYSVMTKNYKMCDISSPNCILDLNHIENVLIPKLRTDYSIPPPPNSNKKYGGWPVTNPWKRRFDFYRTYKEDASPGSEVPLMYKMSAALLFNNAEIAANQIMAMKDTSLGIDPSLSLAIAMREGGQKIFSDISSTFACGGLDNFKGDYQQLKKL